jgi:hypothetical protein
MDKIGKITKKGNLDRVCKIRKEFKTSKIVRLGEVRRGSYVRLG